NRTGVEAAFDCGEVTVLPSPLDSEFLTDAVGSRKCDSPGEDLKAPKAELNSESDGAKVEADPTATGKLHGVEVANLPRSRGGLSLKSEELLESPTNTPAKKPEVPRKKPDRPNLRLSGDFSAVAGVGGKPASSPSASSPSASQPWGALAKGGFPSGSS